MRYSNFTLPKSARHVEYIDSILLLSILALMTLGFIMVSSSSIAFAQKLGLSWYYFPMKQAIYIFISLLAFTIVTFIPIAFLYEISWMLLIICIFCLILLLIPGVSRSVNGSTRWLFLGPFSFQPSEFVKLGFIFYLSGYMVRHYTNFCNSLKGFMIPMLVLASIALLILAQPDFGSAVVIIITAFGMMFLAGLKWSRFIFLLLLGLSALSVVLCSSSYRVKRLVAFLNPWEDQFNTGYQLVQALIAFGSGGVWGRGLGGSIQKMLYLPEAHTDFLFAIVAEELGLVGAVIVMLLFALLITRIFRIARRAVSSGMMFAAHVAFGIGIWLALQFVINIGVNVGLLPTKGLTLPFMSKGGSSMIAIFIACGVLFRINYEVELKKLSHSLN